MTVLGLQKTRVILPSFVLAMLVLLLVGLAAYRQGRRNVAAEQWVRHTYEVLGELNTTFSLMQDVETSSRGYVLTGEDSYLEPFNNALQLIPQKIHHLRQLTADNPEQQRRLDALEPLISLRVRTADANIVVRRTRGFSAVEPTLNEGQGKMSMDAIRGRIAEFAAAENQLLERRTDELRVSNIQTLALFIALVVLLAGLLTVTLFLVRRNAAVLQREFELTEKARAYAENIVDTVRQPLLVLDAELRVQSANRSFYQVFQITAQETEGKPFYELGKGQWDIPALRPLLAEILPRHTSFQDFEVEQDFPSIGRRTMLFSARKLFRVGNNTELVLLAIEDTTERKSAEKQLQLLNARLKEHTLALETANLELEAFTYSVSHDLRAPLRHIAGFSKILKEDFAPHLPAEGQRMVERIQAGARNAGQLVDDLLGLSQVGRKELKLEIVGLKGVVQGVVRDLEGEAMGREIEWRVGELPFVECDAALIKQVMANLLSNALKYTRPRPKAVIEVGTREQDGRAVVYVRDNGVGFSMKYADKLFGVFQRLHRAEDFEGTGVGLATVQRIVHKHGGRVWAEAELDKGAMFCFTLTRGFEVEGAA